MKQTAFILCTLLSGLLSGCNQTLNTPVGEASESQLIQPGVASSAGFKGRNVSYYDEPIIKNVNHYAKWLTQDLFANIDNPNNSEVFVVTDFALLDSDLRKTNHFGRQFSEAIMHEVNKTGFSVIDMKSSGTIRMSETGDMFFHSKELTELNADISSARVISGTMTRHRGGYLLNSRITDVTTAAVITSAQIFVPYEVVEAVLLEDTTEDRRPFKRIRLKAAKVDE